MVNLLSMRRENGERHTPVNQMPAPELVSQERTNKQWRRARRSAWRADVGAVGGWFFWQAALWHMRTRMCMQIDHRRRLILSSILFIVKLYSYLEHSSFEDICTSSFPPSFPFFHLLIFLRTRAAFLSFLYQCYNIYFCYLYIVILVLRYLFKLKSARARTPSCTSRREEEEEQKAGRPAMPPIILSMKMLCDGCRMMSVGDLSSPAAWHGSNEPDGQGCGRMVIERAFTARLPAKCQCHPTRTTTTDRNHRAHAPRQHKHAARVFERKGGKRAIFQIVGERI